MKVRIQEQFHVIESLQKEEHSAKGQVQEIQSQIDEQKTCI